jgi:acetyl-CoA synthetase
LIWFKEWDKVLDWDNPPFAKWFVGGKLNASVNCLDKHIINDDDDNNNSSIVKNKAAIIWESESGETSTLTYYQLYQYVNKFSNALKNLGVKKGDCVTIYLPMVPELPIAMLSCARIGAVHNVVFSGFSSQALSNRVKCSASKVIITADGGSRRGKLVDLKKIVDEVVNSIPSIGQVVVLKRSPNTPTTIGPKYVWWHDIIENEQSYCQPEIVDSMHPLYLLFTSGTTGTPKAVVRATGGYLTCVSATAKWIFNFRAGDIYFCTGDIGWVLGHDYFVYSPLMHGVTEIMYEGAPDYPKADRYWRIIEKHGATILYTTPTALRMYMKFGDTIPNSFDLSSLRLLGTVGEPINPNVWMWYFKTIGKENCPIVDTWGQTETGGIMISACTGIDETIPMKPGSATFPVPGVDAAIVDENGKLMPPNRKGYLVIRKPWPGMLVTLWQDNEKYKNTYWKKFQNLNYCYYSGDYAVFDDDGYFWLLGRADDILKVSGHRFSTAELENAFLANKEVAEVAVTTRQDQEKGDVVVAFLVLRTGFSASDQLQIKIIDNIRRTIGSIASHDQIYFVSRLPKTRTGKVLRRVLKSIVNDEEEEEIGDISTIQDDGSLEEIKQAYSCLKR